MTRWDDPFVTGASSESYQLHRRRLRVERIFQSGDKIAFGQPRVRGIVVDAPTFFGGDMMCVFFCW